MSSLPEGHIIDRKYQVGRVLGRGGMGIVVAAQHLQLAQRVAIKFLLPDAAANPDIVERFLREARAAVRIESEHVVKILDVGTLQTGEPYIVMEHLEGTDLSEVLEKDGPLEPADAVDAVIHACEALAEAHALGIVHRDLKPANLFRVARRDGSTLIKVLDFGISTASCGALDAEARPRLTLDGSVIGTVLYMSPEQLRAPTEVDPRADIWSLGVVLYELLTTQVPFDAGTLPEVMLRITVAEPPSVRASRPDIEPELAEVIARCLAKSPDDRFANVAELAAALAPFAHAHVRSLADGASHLLGVDGVASLRDSGALRAEKRRSKGGASSTKHPLGETPFGTAFATRQTAIDRDLDGAPVSIDRRKPRRAIAALRAMGAVALGVAAFAGVSVGLTHAAHSPAAALAAGGEPHAIRAEPAIGSTVVPALASSAAPVAATASAIAVPSVAIPSPSESASVRNGAAASGRSAPVARVAPLHDERVRRMEKVEKAAVVGELARARADLHAAGLGIAAGSAP